MTKKIVETIHNKIKYYLVFEGMEIIGKHKTLALAQKQLYGEKL